MIFCFTILLSRTYFMGTEKSCKKLLGEGRASLECHAPNHTKTQAAILEVANIYYGPKILNNIL